MATIIEAAKWVGEYGNKVMYDNSELSVSENRFYNHNTHSDLKITMDVILSKKFNLIGYKKKKKSKANK